MPSINDLDKLVDNLAPKFSKLWTKHSAAKGWDSGVADSVGVIFGKDHVSAKYPANMATKVESLEFGDLATKTPPTGAIRAFAEEADKTASDEIAGALFTIFDDMLAEAL